MRFRLALVIALVCGFVALSYEILWYRVFSVVSWSSPAAFGLLLAFYLAGIAIGSRRSRTLLADGQPDAERLRTHRMAMLLLASNMVGYAVVPLVARFAVAGNWAPALLPVGIAAGLLGAVLPLVAHYGIAADEKAGELVSYIYVSNIMGSTLGSLLTGFVLMDSMSTASLSTLLAIATLVATTALVLVGSPVYRTRGLAAVAVSLVVILATRDFAFDRLYERLVWKNHYDDAKRFRTIIENRHGVIAVSEQGTVYGGGAYDGAFNVSLRNDRNKIARALAVGAMHPAPRQVLVIGIASGSWTRLLANLPGVEHIVAIEINPGYLDLIEKEPNVSQILHDPKVEIVIDDGRRWLHRHPEARFDAIVMNTTWHFRAHSTNLLSAEFLALARTHLLPGGIHYYNATSSLEVARTAATVFPYMLRVANFIAVSDSPLVFDSERWQHVLSATRVDGKVLLDPAVEGDAKILAHLLEWPTRIDLPDDPYYSLQSRDSILRESAGRRIITDDNMAPEWSAFLNFPGPADDP